MAFAYTDALLIFSAFGAGIVVQRLGFPPLVGYLLAGFGAHYTQWGNLAVIEGVAHIGVILLLFTIGLKLNLRELAAPQVWGVSVAHSLIAMPITFASFWLLAQYIDDIHFQNHSTIWLLAFALSFSSTVFAVKTYEGRGEGNALHSDITIGVLVMQDIAAVIYLVFAGEHQVGVHALWLLLLPILRPVLLWLLKQAGHGELMMLLGIAAALGAASLFEFLHLEASFGALIAGVLLGDSAKSTELYKALADFKDVFLIGFFLQVGFSGLPPVNMLWVVLVLTLLLLLRPVIYFYLLTKARLRARTAFLSALGLFNYSEFGLIVAAIAVSAGSLEPQWLTTIALALVLSFILSSAINKRAHGIYEKNSALLIARQSRKKLIDKHPVQLGDCRILVLGMGRVGTGAYYSFQEEFPGQVAGIDDRSDRVEQLVLENLQCFLADARDYDFWQQINLNRLSLILITLANHEERMNMVMMLKQWGFTGKVAAVSHFPDEQERFESEGCISFNVFAEAGYGFAEHVLQRLRS